MSGARRLRFFCAWRSAARYDHCMIERPLRGVLRLQTRSPNEFVVVSAERRGDAGALFLAVVIVAASLFFLPLPLSVRLVIAATPLIALVTWWRVRPAVDLWLERPLRDAPAAVAARIELRESSAAPAYVRVTRAGEEEPLAVFETVVEKRGRSGVVRFKLDPVPDAVTIDVVIKKRHYRFIVR